MSHTRAHLCIAALLSVVACDHRHLIGPAGPEAALADFVAKPRSAPADGTSLVTLVATVTRRDATRPAPVTFSTSGGALISSAASAQTVTIGATSADTATVQVRAPRDSALVYVRATAGDVTKKDSIVFTRALPESIQLEPNPFAIQASPSASVVVTAYLRRSVGLVSPGTPLRFSATAPNGADPGILGVPSVSDSQGVVTIKYSPGTTSYRGPVTVTATLDLPGTPSSISGQTTVQLLP